jgi:hypothetical protein
MYSIVKRIFHTSIRINCNRISDCWLHLLYCCMAVIEMLLFYTLINSSWKRTHKGWLCLVRWETCVDLDSYILLSIITSTVMMMLSQQSQCFLRTVVLNAITVQRAFLPYFSLSMRNTIILRVVPSTETCLMIFAASQVIRNGPVTPPHTIYSASFLPNNLVFDCKSEIHNVKCLSICSQALLRLLLCVAAHWEAI